MDIKNVLIELKKDYYNTQEYYYENNYTNNFKTMNEKYDLEKMVQIKKILLKIDNEKCLEFVNSIENVTNFEEFYYIINDEIINSILNPILLFLQEKEFNIQVVIIKNEVKYTFDKYDVISKFNDIDKYIETQNYKAVLTNCSSLLESVYKEILSNNNFKYKKSSDLKSLTKEVLSLLNIKISNGEESKEIRTFISKLNILSNTIAEIRNLYSESHAVGIRLEEDISKIPHHHFQLVVDTTKSISKFLIGSLEYKNSKN